MTSTADKRIDSVYHSASREQLTKTYDDWASDYDADMQSTGYVHPAIITSLVARFIDKFDAKILDAGVGTGLAGELLTIVGYSHLFGLDMSEGMLARAAKRNVYKALYKGVLGEALDLASASMDAVISTGTFTDGHAPASAFDELVRITRPGGYLIFSVGNAAWTGAGFQTKIETLEQSGKIRMVEPARIYRPMPLSQTEGQFTAMAHVYQRA